MFFSPVDYWISINYAKLNEETKAYLGISVSQWQNPNAESPMTITINVPEVAGAWEQVEEEEETTE